MKHLRPLFLFMSLLLGFLALPFTAGCQVKGKLPFTFSGEIIQIYPWNQSGGLHFQRGVTGVYGSGAFTRNSKGKLVFLNQNTQKVRTFSERRVLDSFQVPHPPALGLFADSNRLFLTGLYHLTQVTPSGKVLMHRPFPGDLKVPERVDTFNGQVYLLSADQRTYRLRKRGYAMYKGWIVAPGRFARAVVKDPHHYRIEWRDSLRVLSSRTFYTTQQVASVKIVGMLNNHLVLDVEYFETHKPLEVRRALVALSHPEHSGMQVNARQQLPDLYKIDIHTDLLISNDSLYYYLAHPHKAMIYQCTLTSAGKGEQLVDEALFSKTWHYNKHTLSVSGMPKGNDRRPQRDCVVTPISRREVIERAEAFESHEWEATEANIYDHVWCDNQDVISAPYVQTDSLNRSIPYMWDGFSSIARFDSGMTEGLSAGNINTEPSIGSLNCAEGVDCSGFVSQAWNTEWKYDTREFYPILEEYDYWIEMRPGDVANRNGHIRLLHSRNENGTLRMLEATSRQQVWRVVYFSYSYSDLEYAYKPYRLYSIYEENTAVFHQDKSAEKLSVRPNPAQKQIVPAMSAQQGRLRYQILDMQGRIKQSRLWQTSAPIPVRHLSPGIYYLRIFHDDRVQGTKFVKIP